MRVLWFVARVILTILGAAVVLAWVGWRLLGWRMARVDAVLAEAERKLRL